MSGFLLSISSNDFIVDSIPIFCLRFNKTGKRSNTFIDIYCKDCEWDCEGDYEGKVKLIPKLRDKKTL